jgi:hypothetical protein
VPTRAARPYRGHADADPKGASWGSATRTRISRCQGPAGCRYPTPHRSPHRVLPPAGTVYKAIPVVGPKGSTYARRESNPDQPGPRPGHLPVAARAHKEPPPGADPGHPPYEGEAAAVRGGGAAPRGFEPRFAASGAAVLPFRRKGIEYGRRESNAHAASFGEARSASCRHSRMVRRQGFEPRPYELRARCSSQLS